MITVGYLKEILKDEEILEEVENPNDIEMYYYNGGPMSDGSTVAEIYASKGKLYTSNMVDISWDFEDDDDYDDDNDRMEPDQFWDNASSITIGEILKLYKDCPDDTPILVDGDEISEQGDIQGNGGKLLII